MLTALIQGSTKSASNRLHKVRDVAESKLWLRSALKSSPIVLQDDEGFRFVVYPWDRGRARRLLRREVDRPQLSAMRLLINPGATVLDVGANVGRFSVALARLVGAEGRVFAFEPVAATCQMLQENLALNQSCRIVCIQAAVTDQVGPVTINLFEPQYSSWNTLGRPSMPVPGGRRIEPMNSISVAGITIDEFCKERRIEHVDFMKVDVEGFESLVFHGSARMLRERRIDSICFEISREPMKGAGFTAKEIFESVESYGYSVYRFDEEQMEFTGPVHDTDAYWDNYYASYRPLPRRKQRDATP